jgi:hypothetical protein
MQVDARNRFASSKVLTGDALKRAYFGVTFENAENIVVEKGVKIGIGAQIIGGAKGTKITGKTVIHTSAVIAESTIADSTIATFAEVTNSVVKRSTLEFSATVRDTTVEKNTVRAARRRDDVV